MTGEKEKEEDENKEFREDVLTDKKSDFNIRTDIQTDIRTDIRTDKLFLANFLGLYHCFICVSLFFKKKSTGMFKNFDIVDCHQSPENNR